MTNVSESQGDLDAAAVERSARALRRMIADGIEIIGGIEVAGGIVGLSRGDLRRCIDGDGRHLAVQHAMAIGTRLRLYNASLATKIAGAFVAPFDLEVFPRVTLTTDQKLARAEAALLSLGPVGKQLLDDAYGVNR